MDGMCARCARQVLASGRGLARAHSISMSRTFSSSVVIRENGPSNNSSEPGSNTSNRPSSSSAGRQFGDFIAQALKNSNAGSTDPPSGQVLRRSRLSSNPDRTTNSTPSPGPPGQLLRRTSSPRTPRGRSSYGQKPGSQNQGQSGRRRRDPTKATAKPEEADDEESSEEKIQDYIKKAVDRPLNPTESIPYNPQAMTMQELRADWPDTPLSATGLIKSVQQRIDHLARRYPHSYKTPEQLAERLHDGDLVRLDSADEKEKVLQIATNLAQKRADELTERKGEEVKPADMAFDDINSRQNERKSLVDAIVKGAYAPIEKQRTPLLDNVVHALGNNVTYGSMPTGKFMDKIQALMPPPSGGKNAPQRQRKQARD